MEWLKVLMKEMCDLVLYMFYMVRWYSQIHLLRFFVIRTTQLCLELTGEFTQSHRSSGIDLP